MQVSTHPEHVPMAAGKHRVRRFVLALLVLFIVAVGAGVLWMRHHSGVPGWGEYVKPQEPQGIKRDVLITELNQPAVAVSRKAYEDLFKYFLAGFVSYRSALGARAYYPGAHSENGWPSDGLEGFARFFPTAAAWLASGKSDVVDLGDHKVALSEIFKQGLLAGTDPTGPEYWGTMRDYSQIGYESGDIAVALWISRDQIWNRLTTAERHQIATWLEQVLRVKMYPGNWSLVPLVVHRSLKVLGVDVSWYDERAETTFERFRSLYRGDGWFVDPPNGFDYYNSWAIQYHLFWLSRMDPGFHGDFIHEVQTAFDDSFKYLFGPNGHPMYGRSVCYRMGAATGLLTAATAAAPDSPAMGQAMRALDASVRFFSSHDALAAGGMTQGFCGTDLRVVDSYTGPASCLQGLRALTVAFFLDNDRRVFDITREPLPVETADFRVHNGTTNWTITGTKDTGTIEMTIDTNPPDARLPFAPYTLTRRILEFLLRRPDRPNNHRPLYFSRTYSTAHPGIGCTRTPGD